MNQFAAISIERCIEYADTDASGYWHYTAALRLAEAAETELHRRCGTLEALFVRTPRSRVEVDLLEPLRFGDPATVQLEIAEIGRTSVTYTFRITSNGRVAAAGRIVVVMVDRGHAPMPIPELVRQQLTEC